MTGQTQKAAPAGGKQVQVPLRPFRIGAQVTDDEVYDETVTTNASTQRLPLYSVPSTAFLNDVQILVEATTSGNDNNVTFAANGPWNIIDSIKFTDTSQQEIIGPITGYELYVINKFGGYRFQDDPKASPVYSATTGTGATGGSFAFVLHLPVELVPRDALGSLVNKSQSTPYKVSITVAATATIYGTAPDNAPSVRFRMTPKSYWEPTAQDGSGNPVAPAPPGLGTTQYWNSTPYTVAAGTVNEQLTSSVGFPIRNLIFILEDSNQSRSQGESDWPDPFKLQLQSNIIVDRIRALWRHEIAQLYGYTAAVSDVVNAKDYGVYVLPFCNDFAHKPGWESRRSYLRTTDGMRLKVGGSIGGTGVHKLTVLTNYVAVGAGATLAQVTT